MESNEDQSEEFNNLPNQLTLMRIILVPIMVAMMMMKTHFWDVMAVAVFAVAAITDIFDGYYARSRKIVTVYGKLMDPLADKFLVVAALVMLLHFDRVHPVIVILLICRELGITGLRALASAEGLIIPAGAGGKIKTISQMVAIPFIMYREPILGIPIYEIGHGLLYFSLAVSLWSAQDYIFDFVKAFKEQRAKKREARLKKQLSRIQRKKAAATENS